MQSIAEPERSSRLWTKNFILLASGNLLLGIAFYFLVPILPIYLKDVLHIPFSMIGILMAVFTVSALAIRPFAGFWLDRFDRRVFYRIAFAFMVALFALYPLALGWISIALLRLAHGGAWGMTTTASSTIVADIVPARRRGEGIGLFGLSMTLALSLGPLLGIAIVKHSDFPSLFYSGFGLGLAGFALALFVSCPRTTSRNRFTWNGLIEPSTIPVSLVQLVVNLSYGGLLSYVAMYGKQIGIGNPGNFFLLFAIGTGLSRLWSGKVFDRRGPALLLRSGFAMLVAGYALLSVTKNAPLYLLSAFIIGSGNGIIMPSFQTMANAIVPRQRRGAANSTFFAGFDIGMGTGMIFIGFLAEKCGLRASFLVCSVIALCAFALFETITLRHYKDQVKIVPKT